MYSGNRDASQARSAAADGGLGSDGADDAEDDADDDDDNPGEDDDNPD